MRRKEVLATGEVYHIYNRATEKRVIFGNQREFKRFIDLVKFYHYPRHSRFSTLSPELRKELIDHPQGKPLVDIICYCIMENHFHFLIKQLSDGGITQFMRKISDGYSKYFNILNNRVGPLFQGNFKAVRIIDSNQLIHVSRYIHLNPIVSLIVKNLDDYPWSSYLDYTGSISGFCNKDLVLGQFRSNDHYQKFVLDHADYAIKLKMIEHLMLENS